MRSARKRENEDYQESSSATSLQLSVDQPENDDPTDQSEADTPELEGRPRRSRREPDRCGNVVPSCISKLFYTRGEEMSVFTVREVNKDDMVINQEMVNNSRQAELQGWYEFNVVREVPLEAMLRSNVRPLLTKWVDVWKTDTYGTQKMKSRLCIMGNLEKVERLQTYSPTVSREMTLLSIHIMAVNQWTVRTLDVKQAFLQSDELEREVYVLPPIESGLDDKTVWKLRVAVYGLADGSREWYKTTRRHLLESGLLEVTTEPSLFYSVNEQGRLDGILAAHVDDFLYGGENSFLNKIETFKAKGRVGATQRDNVMFCGLEITRTDKKFMLKQEKQRKCRSTQFVELTSKPS